MTDAELRKLPWYGGNKIPASYVAKFMPKQEHAELPHDLRIFLNQLTKDTP